MKKISIILASALIFFASFGVTFAQEEANQNIILEKGEIVDHDYFAGGETVTIAGTVNGDVFAAGGSVTVDGQINGDLIAGGGTISILGNVSDDVRIGGGNIFIDGTIGRNLTVAGGNINISNRADIGGSLLVMGGNLELKAPIKKDVRLYVGRGLVDSWIGGNLEGASEELTLTSQARVGGDFIYESPKPATVSEKTAIIGETVYKPSAAKKPALKKGWDLKPRRVSPWAEVASFAFSLFLGWLYLKLFPKRFRGVLKTLSDRPSACLGVGILVMLLFVPLMVLLAASLVGILLIPLYALLFVLLAYISKIFLATWIGEKLLKNFAQVKSEFLMMLIGLVVYYLLRLVPVVGGLTLLVFSVFGLGAFFLDQKALRRK